MINPKFLYIAPRDVSMAYRKFPVMHFIDLPNNQILLSAEFHDETGQEHWEGHGQVEPVAPDGGTVSEKHQVLLAHLGVTPGDSAKLIRKKLKAVHKLI